MTVITQIEDLRRLAQKRVPRMFYDYADSGSWTESTYRSNEADFARIKLRQRVAVDMRDRSTATTMIGQKVAMPLALAHEAVEKPVDSAFSVVSADLLVVAAAFAAGFGAGFGVGFGVGLGGAVSVR